MRGPLMGDNVQRCKCPACPSKKGSPGRRARKVNGCALCLDLGMVTVPLAEAYLRALRFMAPTMEIK